MSEIVRGLPLRITEVVQPWAESSPHRLALVEKSGAWTYLELGQAIAHTTAFLLEAGIRPGDRVMIICENCKAAIALFLALANISAWSVLVNARLSAREVDEIRQHSGARRILYTTSVSPHARQHAKQYGAELREVPYLGSIGVGALDMSATPELVNSHPGENVAALIYTSGTTGVPKGVMLSHKNLLYVAAISARLRQLTPSDRLYGVLPMSHAVGLSVVVLGTLLSGATLYLSPRFDPVAVLSALKSDGLTVVLGVPFMFSTLVEYAKSKGISSVTFPALRIISSSGAPLYQNLKAAVEHLFGQPLHNGYGVTETSPNIAQTSIDSPHTDTSVGQIFPGVEIRIVNPDQLPVAKGEVGELWVRGPNVMKGYYKNSNATAAAIDEEGWFNTCDLVKFEDGRLFIVGRTKELIIRFGFNIYPAEVELILNSHPDVVRSAVIGRSADGEEEVVAFVQLLQDSRVTVGELAAHAAGLLTSYKQPAQIFIVSEIPTTPTGKAKKAELAKMYSISTTSR